MSKELKKITPDGNGMRLLADLLKELLPKEWGFVLLTYPFGGVKGLANYVSNAQRQDIIKFLRETANRLEKGTDYQTPNNN